MTNRVCPNLRFRRFRADATLRPGSAALLLACAVFLLCCTTSAGAQQPVSINLVLLDPAHGGPDPGAHLTATLAEKEVTLAFAARLRTTLAAKGFTVVATRDGDTGMTSVQRGEMANHLHPLACLLLHATSSGSGVYLGASSLAPDAEQRAALPWETAQATFVAQSLALLDDLTRSLTAISGKPTVLRASVPPIDSLTCAAVLVELAPLSGKPVTDEAYQQKVADSLADALVAWRTQETPVKPSAPPYGSESMPGVTPATPRPRPRVVAPSPEAPAPGTPARPPAGTPQ